MQVYTARRFRPSLNLSAASPPQAANIDNAFLSQPSLDMAASWKSLQTGFASLNIGQSASQFAKGVNSSVQATKERLGQVAPEDITELPQGMSGDKSRRGDFMLTIVISRIQRS